MSIWSQNLRSSANFIILKNMYPFIKYCIQEKNKQGSSNYITMKITCKQTDYRYQSQNDNLFNLYRKFVILRVELDQFLKPSGYLDKNLKLREQ